MTCILSPGLPVGALGLEHSLIWRPGAKLLLGPTLFLIRRNRPLFQEAVNLLVMPKHVFYSALGEPHQYICPLPSPQEEKGSSTSAGYMQSSPCVSYQERLAARVCAPGDAGVPAGDAPEARAAVCAALEPRVLASPWGLVPRPEPVLCSRFLLKKISVLWTTRRRSQ